MKYLFVDTNNYIACALLSVPEQSPEMIDELSKIVESGRVKLILPDIVEIEFLRELELELDKIELFTKKFVEIIRREFRDYIIKSDKEKYILSAQDIYKKRKRSSEAAKKKLESLFKLEIVKRVKLSPEIFVAAYKRTAQGKKPCGTRGPVENAIMRPVIDDDCIIFESVLSLKSELEDNELIFCSANHKHFARFDEKQKRHVLDPDLRLSFPEAVDIKYHLYLTDVMKSEFKKEISKQEIYDFRGYFDQIGKFDADMLRKFISQLADIKLDSGFIKEIAKAEGFLGSFKAAIANLEPSWSKTILESLEISHEARINEQLAQVFRQVLINAKGRETEDDQKDKNGE
jgi:hypothetical protein